MCSQQDEVQAFAQILLDLTNTICNLQVKLQ